MTKKNKTYKDYLSNLLSFLNSNEEMPQYDVDQVLVDAGYEPNDVGKKFQAVAKESIAKSPHNWRNRARVEHEDAKSSFLKKNLAERAQRSRSEILNAIHALLSQQNLKISLAHRNFADQTDEDLESLLNQLEYVASQKPKDSDE